jgi:predicted transcriptional regulator
LNKNTCRVFSELDSYIEGHDYGYILQASYKTYKEDSGQLAQINCLIPIGINASYNEEIDEYIVKYL